MSETTATPSVAQFYRLFTSQAVLGESVGIQHYAQMIPLARTNRERLHLLEDAWRERAHLLSMQEVAKRAGVVVAEPKTDPYWSKVMAAFREKVAEADLLGLYVIQDIVLEAYAVVLYESLLPVLDDKSASAVTVIAADEREHLATGIRVLADAYSKDPEGTVERVNFANERVASVLAGWVKVEDCVPVCGVCGMVGGSCGKDDLRAAGVDVEQFQPAFAEVYGDALREAGLPPESVMRWLARLLA